MREFAFTVTYGEGADHLMDVFIEHPGLYARTVSCHATTETMWRVDEVTGPREALSAYDEQLEGLGRCSSLRGMGGCPVDWTHEVLEKRPTQRRIYSRQSEGEGRRSVPTSRRNTSGTASSVGPSSTAASTAGGSSPTTTRP